jgi:Iron-dependent Transcriptional regulator
LLLYYAVDLSPKTEYALLALMELAKRFKDGEPLQTRQIADQQQIPDRCLEQLLAIPRQQGIVSMILMKLNQLYRINEDSADLILM